MSEFNRWGVSESEWNLMTPLERVMQYNRQNKCEHKVSLNDWPQDLWESYSRDPYAHVGHMLPHTVDGFFNGACGCQTCVNDIGIERDSPFSYKRRRKLASK